MTDRERIAFVGGGNMAASLVGGLVADGYPANALWVGDPDTHAIDVLGGRFGVHTSTDNRAVVRQAATVVFAVKPQVVASAVQALAPILRERRPLIVSIAAGVREPHIRRWLGYEAAIVRAMPNTPALVQSGATALYANEHVTDAQRNQAESVLRAVGITLWIEDEALMDAVTALSGSGPAYVFLLMEAMEGAARELGLPPETARTLTLQTVLGGARIALESEDDPATLRRRVTSPGGTTEQAVRVLEEGGIRELFVRALRAARDRSAELGKMLGDG